MIPLPRKQSLAAACTETGNFPKTIETTQKTLDLAQKSKNTRLLGKLPGQIERYRRSQPLRLPREKTIILDPRSTER